MGEPQITDVRAGTTLAVADANGIDTSHVRSRHASARRRGERPSRALRFDERTGFHRAPAYKYATLIQAARERGLAVDDQLCSGFRAIEQTPAPPSLRPYQEQVLAAFQRFGRRGIIALPTGSGKTRAACAALAYARVSTLVLVPTRVLLDQWVATLRSQFGDPIGVVGDGMQRLARITVMTFESGYRCLDRFGDARKERETILEDFRERRVRAICSARVLNEGVDVPEANVAIIVAGALGAREHVQRIGRILRPSEGKRALAYELVTLGSTDEARTRARRRRLATGPSAPGHVA
ncbi:MAG: helicase-related protein [Myxococcota bacterium]